MTRARPNPSPEPSPVARRRIGIGDCEISPRAKQLVLEALDSNRLSAGPMTERFERQFAGLHGCAFGLMSNSGTSALHVALAALKEREGWHDGDEVLVPALTFVATANVVLHNGLRPVFVDVEPDYFCIDPGQLDRHVTPRTRAILPVHVGGLPCEMDPIMALAGERGLRIVEDSAEAVCVRYRGRPVGSFGDIGCFSTYIAHLVTTGVGGLSTTNDPELQELMKSLVNHGRDAVYTRIDDDDDPVRSKELRIPERRFSFVRLGHSFRATEMEAALGIAQLEEYEWRAARRRVVFERLHEGLTEIEERLQLPRTRPGAEHGHMFFAMVLPGGADDVRDALVAHLEERGIETRPLLPLVNQPVYRRLFGDLEPDYPVAARLNGSALYVGCQPELRDDEVDYMVESVLAFFARR